MSTVTLPMVFVADVERLQRTAQRLVFTWACSEVTLTGTQATHVAACLAAINEATEKIGAMLP